MTLDEIFEEWTKDSVIDETNLSAESLKISRLHVKYYRYFSNEKLLLKKQETELQELKRLKTDYYTGIIDYETLKELEWQPFQLKILRSDVPQYLQSDKDVINKSLKLSLQQEKVELLQDIIKTIHSRNFVIKSAIDFMRFQSGA